MNKIVSLSAFALALMLSGSVRASDDTYAVTSPPVQATVGIKTEATVTLLAKQGWHINAEAPLTLKLTPTDGVRVDKNNLARTDLASSSKTSARFDVGLLATRPGHMVIDAEASFVLCETSACRPIREKVSLDVDATEPKTPPVKKSGRKHHRHSSSRHAGD